MDDFLRLNQACWYARAVVAYTSLLLCGGLIYAAWKGKKSTGRLFAAVLLCVVLTHVLAAAACFARLSAAHGVARLDLLVPIVLSYACLLVVVLFFFGLLVLYVQHRRQRNTRWIKLALLAAPVLVIVMLILIIVGYGREMMTM
jgi:uncharacterized iron-regulated membrane protein